MGHLCRVVLLELIGMVNKSSVQAASGAGPQGLTPNTLGLMCFKIQIWFFLLDFRKEIHGRYSALYSIPIKLWGSSTQSSILRILEVNTVGTVNNFSSTQATCCH